MEANPMQELGAEGGKARALSLSKAERSEIARQAASARWHKDVPQAVCEGMLAFAGIDVPCAVLPDGTRVLSERGVAKGFGLKRAGSNWQRKDSGARMPVFASANNVISFMDEDLKAALLTPIQYRQLSGTRQVANGVQAILLPKVCDAWLRARDANALHVQQLKIATHIDLIMRGFAVVGIVALIDEATGYQDERARDALAKILEQFVTEELRPWVKTFPLTYFRELCRLRKIPFSEKMQLPQYFGHLTNDIIYSRLAPGVLPEIQRLNPRVNGRRKKKNFQYLTPEVGHPKLLQHIGSVNTLMKINTEYELFYSLLDKVHPVYRPMPLFDKLNDD